MIWDKKSLAHQDNNSTLPHSEAFMIILQVVQVLQGSNHPAAISLGRDLGHPLKRNAA